MDTIPSIEDLIKTHSPEELYEALISLGKNSPYKKKWDFQDSQQIMGCQSLMYVKFEKINEKLFFEFFSDAIISQGLAALLIHFYQGKTAKEILLTPPHFLTQLNLGHLLSPGRSSGLESLYRKLIEYAIVSCKDT